MTKNDRLILQGSIAYLPFIMLISATVSSGISKKVVGKIGSKVHYMPLFLICTQGIVDDCYYSDLMSRRIVTSYVRFCCSSLIV